MTRRRKAFDEIVLAMVARLAEAQGGRYPRCGERLPPLVRLESGRRLASEQAIPWKVVCTGCWRPPKAGQGAIM
jgi:hypothetical protein